MNAKTLKHAVTSFFTAIKTKNFFNTTQEEFDKIMKVNLKGTYFVSQKIAKYFVENKIKGHILNISSSTGGGAGVVGISYI